MIPECRLQRLLAMKDAGEALEACTKHGYSEGWAICDGALVIYDIDNPPEWFDFECDDDGNAVVDGTWARLMKLHADYTDEAA